MLTKNCNDGNVRIYRSELFVPTGNLWRNSNTPTRERPYFSVKIDAETAKMGGGLCDVDVGTCMLPIHVCTCP